MMIAVISDIHDNLINLQKFLNWSKLNKIKKIICCGDLGNTKTLRQLATNFSGDIFLVGGNAETYDERDVKKYKNIIYIQNADLISLGSLNIGLCHESYKIKKLINQDKALADFIFYGHSHKPWLEKRGNIIIANPGNLADIAYQASFAVLNTNDKKLELKILHNL